MSCLPVKIKVQYQLWLVANCIFKTASIFLIQIRYACHRTTNPDKGDNRNHFAVPTDKYCVLSELSV